MKTGLIKIVLFLFVCTHFILSLSVRAEEHSTFSKNDEKPLVRFGFDLTVLTDFDRKDVQALIDVWMQEFADEKGFRTEANLFDNTDLLIKSFKSGKIDAAITSAINYLRMIEKADTKLAHCTVKKGKKTRKYMVLVHSDSDFYKLEDLKDKKIAVEKKDNAGSLYLNTILLRKSLNEADTFFASIDEKRNISNVIYAVFFKQADACIATDTILDTMIELNPQVGKQLRVIATSPNFIDNVFFIRRDYDEKSTEIISQSLLNIKRTEKGKQIMTFFKIDGLAHLHKTDLDPLRAILDEHNQLKSKLNH